VAGYAVSGRLQGAVPRFAGWGPVPVRDVRARGAALVELEPPEARAGEPRVDRVELSGRTLDEALRDQLAAIGESWSQLTFYLFDPDSWR
jgi:hypothetical protein